MITTLSYNDILSKLKEKGLSEDEIEKRIRKKTDQLSGLISKEGAAHIIANELGVKVFEDVGEIKIKDARAGMRNVNMNGKVTINFGVREFKNDKREGKVGSFVMGDETASIRVVMWDDHHINVMENLREDSVVRVENGYIKENNGYKEIHLNNASKFELNPKGISIGEVKVNGMSDYNEKEIKNLSSGDRVMIKGTIVQVFEPRFYEICKECGRRLSVEEGGFRCEQHGKINPEYACVVSCVLDDGSESIRVVCFREQAGNLLGFDNNGLLKFKDNPNDFDKVKDEVLGKQIRVNGRVNKNEMFDRLEFIAGGVEELNPENLLKESG